MTAGEIPEEVAVAVGTAVGKPLAWRRGAPGGQTLARTWIVERSGGRTAFVKAAGSEHAVTEATRELLVYESVAGSFLPGIFGAAREGEWLVLILEDLGAAVWPPPYPDDPARLFDALRAVASAPAPDGLPRIPSRPEQHNWERVSQAPESVAALGACSLEWLEPALPDLAEAERRLDLSGDALVHNDVWHANLCFAVRGAVLVDWAAASVGDPRLDVAFALLSLRSSGRLPPPVDLHQEGELAAYLAGHDAWSAVQPLPSSLRADAGLREGWIADLHAALPWAAELLGLPPPR